MQDTNTQKSDDNTGGVGGSAGDLAKPVAAAVVGIVLLVVAFAKLASIPRWADDHGAIWVYLGFFVYMSIAGRLFWYGADELIKRLRRA